MLRSRNLIRPSYCSFSAFLLAFLVTGLTGCKETFQEPIADLNKDQKDVEIDVIARHNVRSACNGDWKVKVWMSGSLYEPHDPIELGLYIVSQTGRKDAPPAKVIARLFNAGEEKPIRETIVEPMLALDQLIPPGWQAKVLNLFPRDGEQGRDRSYVVEEGKYAIDLHITIDKEEIDFRKIQFEVRRFIEGAPRP